MKNCGRDKPRGAGELGKLRRHNMRKNIFKYCVICIDILRNIEYNIITVRERKEFKFVKVRSLYKC